MAKVDEEQSRAKAIAEILKDRALTFGEVYEQRYQMPPGERQDETLRKKLQRELNRMRERDLLAYSTADRTYSLTPEGRARMSMVGEQVWESSPNLMLGLMVCRSWLERILPANAVADIQAVLMAAEKDLVSAERRFIDSGRQDERGNPKSLSNAIRVVAPDLAEEPQADIAEDILGSIFEAILKNRLLGISYRGKRSGKKERQWTVRPLGLVLKGRRLYLIGEPEYEPSRRRAWRVHGITSAECTDKRFSPDPEFDLDTFLAAQRPLENPVRIERQDEIRIVLEIHPDRLGESAATVVDHLRELKIDGWSRQLEAGRTSTDGIVTWELMHPDTEELRRWILGYAPSVVVVEPAYLREELAASVRSLLERSQTPR